MSLQECLSHVVDFRQRNKNFRHELLDILLLSVCAVLSGAEDYGEIALYGQKKEAFLRRFLPLPNGIPSHDTIRRVFMYIDERSFNEAFIAWISYALSGQYRQVSVDGKTLRGSYDSDQPAIHLVSAVASELGLSLGQWKVNEKSTARAAPRNYGYPRFAGVTGAGALTISYTAGRPRGS
jgi:hypothetical protein